MGLDENLPAGTEVGFVSAKDLDAPPFNSFTFSFLAGGSLSDAFEIHPDTGEFLKSTINALLDVIRFSYLVDFSNLLYLTFINR